MMGGRTQHDVFGIYIYVVGIVVCLYFLVDAWIYVNEIWNPLIPFLLAGSGLTLSALRLWMLGRRVWKERRRS
jgi:hypothetical protein